MGKVLINWILKPKEPIPTAIAGSPGLRSIGKMAVECLIEQLGAELLAEVYSYDFPAIYQTVPSYAAHPKYLGNAGVMVKGGIAGVPKASIYRAAEPNIAIVMGYHANFMGQYEVAESVAEALFELGVRRLYVLAGYGRPGADLCCAATKPELLEEAKAYGLEPGYEGPFMGFSGLLLGAAKLLGIDGICIFGRTEPSPSDPEYPDPIAAIRVVSKLKEILKLNVDAASILSKY